MSQPEPWTIGRLLTWTTEHFKKHDSESPRLDAELLLAHACGCERIVLYTRFTDIVDEETRTRFRELVKQRAEGKPVAYLLGRREFYSLVFEVTPDVLIPRPETEFAVIAVLDHLKALSKSDPQVVDIGTGSGAIAITVGKHAPSAQVTAIDISPAAITVARRNAEKHAVSERIRFLQSDLLDALPVDRTLDVVVSNPPYVSDSEYQTLSPEVRSYEPKLALVSGPSGTETIERLIPQAAERLVAGGALVLEISPMIESAVRELIARSGAFTEPKTIKDLAQLARIVIAIRLG